MHIETVRYTDFEGDSRTKDICFHLALVDILFQDNQTAGGSFRHSLLEQVRAAQMAKDEPTLGKAYSRLAVMAYGVPIREGAKFSRPENPRNDLSCLPELDQLMQDLIESPARGIAFIEGILS